MPPIFPSLRWSRWSRWSRWKILQPGVPWVRMAWFTMKGCSNLKSGGIHQTSFRILLSGVIKSGLLENPPFRSMLFPWKSSFIRGFPNQPRLTTGWHFLVSKLPFRAWLDYQLRRNDQIFHANCELGEKPTKAWLGDWAPSTKRTHLDMLKTSHGIPQKSQGKIPREFPWRNPQLPPGSSLTKKIGIEPNTWLRLVLWNLSISWIITMGPHPTIPNPSTAKQHIVHQHPGKVLAGIRFCRRFWEKHVIWGLLLGVVKTLEGTINLTRLQLTPISTPD